MLDTFWLPLMPAYALGLALSFGCDVLLTPRPVAPWRRPIGAVGVHVGVWTVAFALELALFRRPYFGVANVLVVQLVTVFVSNAKYQALREPFVYPDFEYFADAVRHPRLYLPFFGVPRTLVAAGGFGGALWAGLSLEASVTALSDIGPRSLHGTPQTRTLGPIAELGPFFIGTFVSAAVGVVIAVLAGRTIPVTLDAFKDLHRLGLVAALWAYGCRERQPVNELRSRAPYARRNAPAILPDPLPDLVVIQSESFFDARRTYASFLRHDILANFDLLKTEALLQGPLNVAAWGANTVRTEFAFLAGMNPDGLGVHKFNPYRKLAAQGFPTLASYLRMLGYRTVCLHPYHRTFYRRDKILPSLGFDEFIGIEAFGEAKHEGPYVLDRTVGERAIRMLSRTSQQPLYLHVITMENHGPLHWESVDPAQASDVLHRCVPQEGRDLVAYARHLRNADAMFGALRRYLLQNERPTSLCIFGDHVPIMPDVYRTLGPADGSTDYVLWRSDRRGTGTTRAMDVADLSSAYLNVTALQVPSHP